MNIFPDVDDIKVVINYDFPNNSEHYVHRIGRTGRRDKKATIYDLNKVLPLGNVQHLP